MNVYGRYDNYIPNHINHIVEKIPIAKCDKKYNKGNIIIVETHRDKYSTVWNYLGESNGKALYEMKKKRLEHHYCIVWNYLGEKNGDHLHSITRTNYKMKNIRDTGDYIPLSLPESIEYFDGKLKEATVEYEGIKNGHITHLGSTLGNFFRVDDFSMYWAKRRVRELTEKYRLAKKLWSTDFVNNDSSHYLIDPEGKPRESFDEFIATKQQEKTPA